MTKLENNVSMTITCQGPWTTDDLELLPEKGVRHEIIRDLRRFEEI